ncbi:MAG: nucleotidyl transferase AbiEii/AbiGii toxin family protein [Candidatus Micrarchaeota archaeon]|nr:nucleotidyl transferase AbiEii/AbiGii toxin family protein [Candidatus Micrarchaeota archaeon]
MDLAELKTRAVKEGIPLAIMEKDYALSVALLELSKTALNGSAVFKGGTAIKKVYFPNARFSEDLDFTAPMIGQEEITRLLKAMLENKELLGIRFGRLEHEKTSAGLRISIKFAGFLAQPQRIRFDFSFRENAFLPPVEKEVVDSYSLGKAGVLTLQVEEILAEKIQAAFSRTVARDLYDIWFLLKNGVKADGVLICRKFSYYREEYELAKLEGKLGEFKPKWDQDLGQFLKEVPEFEMVGAEVLKELSRQRK